jgi:hypothetical protein
MSNNNMEVSTDHLRNERNLDRHYYREVGISAVAAALQFKSTAKNPAYAPAAPPPVTWFSDDAA